MFNWLRRAKAPVVAEPLLPLQQYAQEAMAASECTAQQGLFVPPVQFIVHKDCVDWAVAEPALQRLIGPYQDEEIERELFAMNVRLAPQLLEGVRLPLRLPI